MEQKDSGQEERRRFERVMVDLAARFTVADEEIGEKGIKSYGGRVINLSRDGACIETHLSSGRDIFRDKQTISAEITLPDFDQPIELKGTATWGTKIDDPSLKGVMLRFGVNITYISPQDAEKLKSYVARVMES